MPKYTDRLNDAFNENPLGFIVVASVAVTAASKLINTMSSVLSRRAYKRQVDYRIKHRR